MNAQVEIGADQRNAHVDALKSGSTHTVPLECDRLTFDEPWKARAFGMALALVEGKSFEFEQFRQSLIKSIAEWEAGHNLDDDSWEYYEQWLSALERIVIEHGIVTSQELDERTQEFVHRTREEVI